MSWWNTKFKPIMELFAYQLSLLSSNLAGIWAYLNICWEQIFSHHNTLLTRVVHLLHLERRRRRPPERSRLCSPASSAPRLHLLDSLCVIPVSLPKLPKKPKGDMKMCKTMMLLNMNSVLSCSPCSFCGFAWMYSFCLSRRKWCFTYVSFTRVSFTQGMILF